MMKSRLLGTVGIMAVVGSVLAAQDPAPPAFEAASVKPNALGPTGSQRGGVFPGERVTLVNYPLRTIIQMAYAVTTAQEIIGPGWIANERFDITAKAEAPSSADQLRAMLRTLLADRFKLAARPDTRNTPVYALVIARSDGRLGPQLHPEAKDCESLRAIARAQPGAGDPCAIPSKDARSIETQFGHYSKRSSRIDLLATVLRLSVDRPVVNKTGLTGSYDWDLNWTPQRFQSPFDHDQFPTVDPNGPTIFTAVQEQLGLKLEPTMGADPVLPDAGPTGVDLPRHGRHVVRGSLVLRNGERV